MLKSIIIFSLFLFQSNLYSQSALESLSEERTSLLAAYEKKPQKALIKKINKLENEVANYIQTNGYPVTLVLPKGTEEIEFRNACYPIVGDVIKTLKNNEQILVLNRDKYGYYKIKVDGQIGYAYNITTNPTFEQYPLQLLTQSLEENEAVSALQVYPSFFNDRRYEFSSQCSSNTYNGKRCETMTSNRNGRCHVH